MNGLKFDGNEIKLIYIKEALYIKSFKHKKDIPSLL